MAYELTTAQEAPLLDQTGSPIPTTALRDPSGNPPPFAAGMAATIQDDGAGFLVCVGNRPGTQTFSLVDVATGGSASHDVTVTGTPFDWDLGTPVAK